MITLTQKIKEFIHVFPGLTATQLSHKMHDRHRLASISSILNQLTWRKVVKREKSDKVWIYWLVKKNAK